MILNEKDLQLFNGLSSSQFSFDLIDYIDRVTAEICDARKWKENDTKESALRAAEYMKTYIRDKITTQKTKPPMYRNEME